MSHGNRSGRAATHDRQRLYPLHNTLFIRLPAGKTFDDARIESIAGDSSMVTVLGDYVTVRNVVCVYGGRDGFSTTRNKGGGIPQRRI